MLWNLIFLFYSKLCPAFHEAKPTLKLGTRHTQPCAALTTSALTPKGVSCPIHSHPGLENAMILHNSCSGINRFAATQLTGIFFFPFSTTCLLLAAAAAAASSPPGRDGPSQNGNWSFVPTYGSMVPWPPRRDDDQSGPWSLGGGCATAAIPGSGRTASAQHLLHRREQFPWISQQFPWISKALNLFSPEPQLSVFECRKRESGIKKCFMETEFATDFFVCVH